MEYNAGVCKGQVIKEPPISCTSSFNCSDNGMVFTWIIPCLPEDWHAVQWRCDDPFAFQPSSDVFQLYVSGTRLYYSN